MRKIIFGLCFLVSQLAWAGPVTPGGMVPSLTVGGVTFTDLSNLKVLFCALTPSPNCTPRLLSGSSGYQVPANKTFVIRAIRFVPGGSGAVGASLGYGTSDVGFGSASAPTGNVTLAGSGSLMFVVVGNAAVPPYVEYPVFGSVPSNDYVWVQLTAGTGAAWVYGYEQ